jgi:hypothetical protein
MYIAVHHQVAKISGFRMQSSSYGNSMWMFAAVSSGRWIDNDRSVLRIRNRPWQTNMRVP